MITKSAPGDFQNVSFSGSGNSYGVQLPYSRKESDFKATNDGASNTTTTVNTKANSKTISGGCSIFESNSYSTDALIDINGDGLPDLFNENTGEVRLNIGYKFESYEDWGVADVNSGISNGFGFSLGMGSITEFNKLEYSWSGGINIGQSINDNSLILSDMNADGLNDIVFVNPADSNLYVKFNNGNGFATNSNWSSTTNIQNQKTTNASGYLAGTFGFTVFGVAKITFNGQGGLSASLSLDKSRLMDFNNDGYPDIVTANAFGYNVQFSNLGKLNKLKTVITPYESSYTMDYELTQSTQDMPNRQWVMNSLKIFDGYVGDGVDTTQFAYEYEDAYYDRFERTSYGFKTVETKQINNASANKYVYSTTIEKFINNDFLFKGNKYYEVVLDSLANKYIETKYTYNNGTVCDIPIAPAYPALKAIDNFFYEGQVNHQMHTKQEFTYDSIGNVTMFWDKRDTTIATDDIQSYITYTTNPTLNLLALPLQIEIKQDTNTYRKRTATYNTSNAELTSLTIDNNGTSSVYNFAYDNYGNMTYFEAPENHNGQNMFYEYTYDNVVQTYPTSVSDAFSYISSTTYDYRIGAPLTTTDIAGNDMEFSYYNDGRLKTVRGPNEIASSAPYSMKFEYCKFGYLAPDSIPWARTIYYDPINSGNTFYNIIFTDALGRVVQSKAKAVVYNPATQQDETKLIVSGKNILDPYGRAIYSYYPVTENPGADTLICTTVDNVNPTKITYDVLGRKTQVRLPDNTINLMNYGFGNDAFGQKQFLQTTTDANGVSFSSYTNALGKQTTLKAPLQIITKFEYDPLGQLLQSTDPESNVTTYSYDRAGQLLQRTHPDAGTTNYTYDAAGNLTSLQTPNLLSQSDFITYEYDYNRITKIDYPINPINNVYYEYGDTANQTGRLSKLQDASGVQTFTYGKLGELIQNIHTFVVPQGEPYTFAMNWEYDSWNRTKSITYPDGEVLTYSYNNSGALDSMSAVKSQQTFNYLNNISYDKFGNRVIVNYGNGTSANYTYDSQTRRLSNLISYDSQSNMMQDIDYDYDNAGNISDIENSASAINGLGGVYNYEYEYDSLYRLISSAGSFTDVNQTNYPFSLDMTYSASGNISSKELTATTLLNGATTNIDYERNYNYYQNQAHTIENIHDQVSGEDLSMQWDANGNMTQFFSSATGETRRMCWDEENRLAIVKDPNYASHYVYNAGGERTWKITGPIERMSINGGLYVDQTMLDYKTLYTSPYMVISDMEYTKHFYAESQRVTTKLGGGFSPSLVNPHDATLDPIVGSIQDIADGLWDYIYNNTNCVNGEPDYISIASNLPIVEELFSSDNNETDLYFYHPDHLGSSSFITDVNGDVNQHLQYLPFGESFIDQQTNHNIRFTFSSKEKDTETNYSYFGARYYSSDLSVWLSVDPLADKYPSMSAFMYCAGNPVMLVDPDGKVFTDFINNKTGETKHIDDGQDQIIAISDQDYNKVDNAWLEIQNKNTCSTDDEYFKIIDRGENIDLDSDLGKMIRMTYAEMYGVGNSDVDRQIVAESIVNRKESQRYSNTYSEVIEGGEYTAFGTPEYNNPYKTIEKLRKESPYYYKKHKNEIDGNWLNAVSVSYKAYNNIGPKIGKGVVSYVSPPRSSTYFDSNKEYKNITSQIKGLKGIVGIWKIK